MHGATIRIKHVSVYTNTCTEAMRIMILMTEV